MLLEKYKNKVKPNFNIKEKKGESYDKHKIIFFKEIFNYMFFVTGRMLEKFFPNLMVDRVQDIDLDLLKKNNIKGLILDIDNTLVASHVKEADDNAIEWIERAKSSGFKVCIVSNASRKRVVKFNEKLKLFAIYRALKPGSRAYKKAARLMDVGLDEAAVIGDQIFTDVYGGNRIGMYTILVKPIHRRESILVMLKRYPEKLVLSKYTKKIQQEDGQRNNS